jgi:DNA directed RNA polymerase, 7 kDa subunit.
VKKQEFKVRVYRVRPGEHRRYPCANCGFPLELPLNEPVVCPKCGDTTIRYSRYPVS